MTNLQHRGSRTTRTAHLNRMCRGNFRPEFRELSAFGTCGPARGSDATRTGEVQMLYVAHDYQELGLGRALLRALFAALRRHRMERAIIWVVAQNPARFFYEAMGWVVQTERTERLWNTDVTTLGYVWEDIDATIQALDERIARVGR